MKKTLFGALILNYCFVFGQEITNSLASVFSKGKVGGHARSFYMHTFNEGDLKDYWTNAVGMSLQYSSLSFYGFSLGIDGVFTFKTFSSDLNETDSLTGKSARWEKQLYDVEHPYNSSDMDRLEELFLQYHLKNIGWFKYGRFAIKKTPLLRLRDGRMKPFSFEGVNSRFTIRSLDISAGGIYKVSPRGTTHWYKLEDAIGLINNGWIGEDKKADYHGSIKTNGLFWVGVIKEVSEGEIQLWNYVLENQLSITWGQWNQNVNEYSLGLQVVYETGLTDTEFNRAQTYINSKNDVGIISCSIERDLNGVEVGVQSSRVFGNSSFKFPKELGLEALYTSIPRSWIEGLGDAEVYNFSLKKSWFKDRLEVELKNSYVHLNQPNNPSFNKYKVKDYLQSNITLSTELENQFEGIGLTFIYALRGDLSEEDLSLLETFNKTNFHQLNFIFNFHF